MTDKGYKLPTMEELRAKWAEEASQASPEDYNFTLPDRHETAKPKSRADRLRAAEEEFLAAYLSYRYSQGIEPCPGHRGWLKAMVRAALGTDTSEWGSGMERDAALWRQIGYQHGASYYDEERAVLMRARGEETDR